MKPFWKSRTFWVNLLTFAASLLGIMLASDFVKENATFVAIANGIIIPAINLILRWLTKEPIAFLESLDKMRDK